MEGDVDVLMTYVDGIISIHSLRMEGDVFCICHRPPLRISIHSLRMEGDMGQKKVMMLTRIFQSTPSAWRETDRFNGFFLGIPVFQSTPSAWRETGICSHASAMLSFQSTPSAWRETKSAWDFSSSLAISIHSLRMEGDRNTSAAVRSAQYFNPLPPHGGRHHLTVQGTDFRHFNPLPPHGGRLKPFEFHARQSAFQSTPSAWRETFRGADDISGNLFQSTPSAWRETQGKRFCA